MILVTFFFPQDVNHHMDKVPLNGKVFFSTNTTEKCCLRFLVFLRVRLNLVLPGLGSCSSFCLVCLMVFDLW